MENVYAVITLDVINSKKSKKSILKHVHSEKDLNKSLYKYLLDIGCIDNDDEGFGKIDLFDHFLSYQSKQCTNHLFDKEVILTNITPQKGDELQVLCTCIKYIPYIIRSIRYYLRPLDLRIAVGIGSINDEYHIIKNSWDMNGEAFHNARQALEIISDNKDGPYNTYFKSNYEYYDAILNSNYILMDMMIKSWSYSRWRSTYLYEEYGKYEMVGLKNGTTTQAARQNCERAKWSSLVESEQNMKKFLGYIENNTKIND